jgi:hypothetical protein
MALGTCSPIVVADVPWGAAALRVVGGVPLNQRWPKKAPPRPHALVAVGPVAAHLRRRLCIQSRNHLSGQSHDWVVHSTALGLL